MKRKTQLAGFGADDVIVFIGDPFLPLGQSGPAVIVNEIRKLAAVNRTLDYRYPVAKC